MAKTKKTRRTLVYKRTHNGDRCKTGCYGDPCEWGCFGCCDCMGQVRAWKFEAVIGIGGIGKEPEDHGIAGKINWIGIGPNKTNAPSDYRGPFVTFDHFRDFGTEGALLQDEAPNLAEYMYAINRRAVMDFSDLVQMEIEHLLTFAERSRPSPSQGTPKSKRSGCCAKH